LDYVNFGGPDPAARKVKCLAWKMKRRTCTSLFWRSSVEPEHKERERIDSPTLF
jgi:hypothetical protein